MANGCDEFSTLKSMARGWARIHARRGDWGSLHVARMCCKFVEGRRRKISLVDFNRDAGPMAVCSSRYCPQRLPK